jgi:type IV pilus assembly protein PilE
MAIACRKGSTMKAANGFTLVELMIVMVVMGVLAALVYPSYVNSVRKTHRADGKQALLDSAQKMERFYSENNTYAGATVGSANTNTLQSATPGGYYVLSFATSPNATTYALTATPQSKGNQNKDTCGNLTLNNGVLVMA